MENNNPYETLWELLAGILFFGILVWLILIWFLERKLYFSLGLGLGIILAVLAAFHMYWSLNKALDMGQAAVKYALSQNMVRYGVIIIAFGVLCVLDFGNPLAAFAGIMGLKAGAYLQPFTHKILSKLRRR
ncbi:MAG: ATP synthase subunit I [Lachnospiraceae bacterium]|mgnify:FL=1|nr:ATP synthase subunit I [Lachnospiraceae bacterium]